MWTPAGYGDFKTKYMINDSGLQIMSFSEGVNFKIKNNIDSASHSFLYGDIQFAWTAWTFWFAQDVNNSRCTVKYNTSYANSVYNCYLSHLAMLGVNVSFTETTVLADTLETFEVVFE